MAHVKQELLIIQMHAMQCVLAQHQYVGMVRRKALSSVMMVIIMMMMAAQMAVLQRGRVAMVISAL